MFIVLTCECAFALNMFYAFFAIIEKEKEVLPGTQVLTCQIKIWTFSKCVLSQWLDIQQQISMISHPCCSVYPLSLRGTWLLLYC